MTRSTPHRDSGVSAARLWALVALAAWMLWAPAASAQPRILLDPATVTLAPGSGDRVLVTVEGSLSGPASIALRTPESIDSAVEPLGPPGSASRQWIVTLSAGPGFDGDSTAIVMLASGSLRSAVPLPIKVKASPSAASLLAANLSFEGETLLDGLERPLLLRLSNLSDLPLEVTVEPQLPRFLAAKGDDWKTASVAPRSTIVIRIPLATAGTSDHPVMSGKHEVTVAVAARRPGNSKWSGQAVATAPVSVGVPGMEAVQGVLQVPSFLLLPGFLLVAAYALTAKQFRRGARTEPAKESPLSLGWTAGHWLVAISLSMILVWLYPLLMRLWLGSPRSILYGFDLGDVIRVWVMSILFGIVAALVVEAVGAGISAWKARSAFSVDLEPLELLDRLALGGTPTNLPFTVDGQGGKLYSLERSAGNGEAWAASAIELTIRDPSKFDADDFRTKVKAGKAIVLRAALADAVGSGAVSLGWAGAGDVRGVARVPAADFAKTQGPGPIIVLK